jgi:hypothetical protein
MGGKPWKPYPGALVRDKHDGERGVIERVYDWPGEGWGEVKFERHGLCRIRMSQLEPDPTRDTEGRVMKKVERGGGVMDDPADKIFPRAAAERRAREHVKTLEELADLRTRLGRLEIEVAWLRKAVMIAEGRGEE